MARNDPNHPELARASQDVEAHAHRDPEGPFHYGRGGANVAKPTPEETRTAHDANKRKSEEARREDGVAGKGLVEKGKEFISKLGGKK
jgi:hypothetical protein